MAKSRFIVMGAGEVGYLVAQKLSLEGEDVTLIDPDPEKRRIEDELDVHFVLGSGTHVPVLEKAGCNGCDLFVAASSSESANLSASLLAKEVGAQRSVVRLTTTEDLTVYREVYEKLFRADLLLSPQVLATDSVLNHVLGRNTSEVDYLARGHIQIRTLVITPDNPLVKRRVRDVKLPTGSRLIGFEDKNGSHPVSLDHTIEPNTRTLVVCTSEATAAVEKAFASKLTRPGTVVVAGAASTGVTIAKALIGQAKQIKVIERDRRRARLVAAENPEFNVLQGDATDPNFLKAENIGDATAFIAATGHDDSNLMAGLEAEELGVGKIVVMVDRSETSRLWSRIGHIQPISARSLAAQRIQDFIHHGYKSDLVTLADGALKVLRRTIVQESPVAGASLEEIDLPNGIVVAAVLRGSKVFMPRPKDRLQPRDEVVLIVHESELATLLLFFPGRGEED